jgi:hypothetical protein
MGYGEGMWRLWDIAQWILNLGTCGNKWSASRFGRVTAVEKAPPSELWMRSCGGKDTDLFLMLCRKENLLALLKIKPRFLGRPSVDWSLHSLRGCCLWVRAEGEAEWWKRCVTMNFVLCSSDEIGLGRSGQRGWDGWRIGHECESWEIRSLVQ